MIERLARAAFEVLAPEHVEDWEECTKAEKDLYHCVARGILEAMREPREAMLARVEMNGGPQARAYVVAAWPDMIDAALASQ